ncbi:hypothetical protein [Actinomadura sp. 6N118]|uniref:hypothetical protein n=1 Tax=Actinomadura sp. 6N118 TaxID=3375151 RepID=UPI00378A217D
MILPAAATRSTIDFRHAPASGWTLICRPDDPHKSLVREDGALLYGFHGVAFDAWHFDVVIEPSAQTTGRPVAVEQRTESAARPIVHTRVRYPGQTLDMIAFASYEDGRRCDIILWTVTVDDESLTGLRLDVYQRDAALAAAGPPPHRTVYPTAPPAPTAAWTDDLPAVAGEPAGTWFLHSADRPLLGTYATGFRPASGLVTTPEIVAGGGSASGAIVVGLGGASPAGVDLAWARARLVAERGYWDELVVQPLALRVPDPDVQDMLTACARNMLQAREIEDGLPVLHVGPTIYRGLWLVDGHFLLEAARYLGLDDTADAGLEILMRRARADGAVVGMQDQPHLKETGIAISTLARQAELSGDLGPLRRYWPSIRAAVAHIQELRAQAAELPADHPLHGVLPEAFADGGLGGRRAEYTTTMWTLIGLRYAVRAARLLGFADDAAEFDAAFGDLRHAFLRSANLRRAIAPDGTRYLPMAPAGGAHQFHPELPDDQVPRWRQIQPETATWAFCHAIWPGEVFAPGEPIVADLLALFDARDGEQGIPATTGWLPYRAVWTYAASFAAHAWLAQGRPDKAADYLYAFANHAHPTRVWREEQPLTGSDLMQICGDMPHNWAAAEFIRLVRHLLVLERGDALELLPGTPPHWLSPGSRITVERTPTRFGRISLDVAAGEADVDLRITWHGADPCPARLHLPAGITDVRVAGEALAVPPGGVLELHLTGELHVNGRT